MWLLSIMTMDIGAIEVNVSFVTLIFRWSDWTKMTEEINDKKDNAVVDMLLSRNVEESMDSETMIL